MISYDSPYRLIFVSDLISSNTTHIEMNSESTMDYLGNYVNSIVDSFQLLGYYFKINFMTCSNSYDFNSEWGELIF